MNQRVKVRLDTSSTNRVRPIQNKVLLSIFNTLGDIEGLRVLDLYSGIGSLSVEAIKKGAVCADLVDISATNIKYIRHRYSQYQDKIFTFNTKVESFISSVNTEYDLIFFDPPYAKFDYNIALRALGLLKSKGVMVLSMSSKTALNSFYPQASIYKERIFGGTKIVYLVKD